MSEWEDYCDSRGMDPHDDDADYGDSSEYKIANVPIKNSPRINDSCLSEMALVSLLLRSIQVGGCDDLKITDYSDGDPGIWSIEQLRYDSKERLKWIDLRIQYETLTPHLLMDVLRKYEIPFLWAQCVPPAWAVWDPLAECIVTRPNRATCSDGMSDQQWRDVSPNTKNPRRNHLIRLLRSAFISSDHAIKPMLLKKDFLEAVQQQQPIQLEQPQHITAHEVDKYVLAFVNADGTVSSVSLLEASDLGVPIATRIGTYVVDCKELFTDRSRNLYLANAFQLAAQCHPAEFEFYVQLEHATIFQQAIKRVDFKDLSWIGKSASDSEPNAMIHLANSISEWGNLIGNILITNGGHPTGSALVTTPAFYEHAVRTFQLHGFIIQSDYKGKINVSSNAETVSTL